MLSAFLSIIADIFTSALSKIVKDWRRDAALEDKGAAEADAKHNAAVAQAERRAAAVPKKDETGVIADLDSGNF